MGGRGCGKTTFCRALILKSKVGEHVNVYYTCTCMWPNLTLVAHEQTLSKISKIIFIKHYVCTDIHLVLESHLWS